MKAPSHIVYTDGTSEPVTIEALQRLIRDLEWRKAAAALGPGADNMEMRRFVGALQSIPANAKEYDSDEVRGFVQEFVDRQERDDAANPRRGLLTAGGKRFEVDPATFRTWLEQLGIASDTE